MRLDLATLTVGSRILLAILALGAFAFAIAAVVAAAAGHYRRMAVLAAGFALCLAIGSLPLRPAIEPAYPTSYYSPTEPYAAASIVRGAAVYAENCVLCHGAMGHGDGPAAEGLPIRPADLTEPHLFAHSPGDLFWWVSHGRDDGVMPSFTGVLSANQRWDVINFIRARAAGLLARKIGPEVTTSAAPQVPDLAFEAGGLQQTLGQTLETGPVLLVLFAPPAPLARRRQLATELSQPGAAGLQVIAVGLGPAAEEPPNGAQAPPFVGGVSSDVIDALALFRTPDDGGETELLLDQAGNVRARWTANQSRTFASIQRACCSAVRSAGLAGMSAVSFPITGFILLSHAVIIFIGRVVTRLRSWHWRTTADDLCTQAFEPVAKCGCDRTIAGAIAVLPGGRRPGRSDPDTAP